MKRTAHLLGFVILAGMLAGVAAAQDGSLAEAARQHRKQKEGTPAAKHEVFTNDNLPQMETISTVGTPTGDADAAPHDPAQADNASGQADAKDGNDSKAAEEKAKLQPKIGDSADQRQKVWEGWRDKISKQKDAIDAMQKDIEQTEKENQLRANTYNGSAQSRIYGGATEAKAEIANQAQMEQRKKAIDQAKQALDDLQEEARRAGIPSSYRE